MRLVEAVDLIDEQDGAAAEPFARLLRLGHHRADFLDPRKHRAERDEVRLRRLGDDARERRLARAWRPPEDDRLQRVPRDRFAERTARAQQPVLPDDLVERAWPHALRQGRRGFRRGCGVVTEQISHACFPQPDADETPHTE